jgi:collagenase-like PrtC family protease
MSDVVDGVSKSYIGQWNITEKPKPTDEELEALSSKAETIKNNSVVVANRQAEYGSTESQLEFLVENGVDAFIARQNEIKNKYPKENS